MAVNKVIYNTDDGEHTLIDLTEDTVTAATLAEGATAHSASGETIVGTMPLLELPVSVENGGTGATTAKDAANNLSVPTLLGGTEIPANADLNNYKTVGSYYCSSDSRAAGLTNCPISASFTMKVFYAWGTSGYVAQEIVNGGSGTRFYRWGNVANGSWQSWKRDYTTASPPTPSDINGTIPITKGGTGATTAADAVNNLGVYSIKSGTAITAGSDLNSYTTVGNYYCSSDGTASGLTNCPIKVSFTMRVVYAWGTSAFVGQEVTNGASGVRFYRWCNVSSGTWSSWNKTITENDLSAIYSRIATLESKVAALGG